MRRTYLICYDIRHERRLARVAKAMRGYGDRVQYSVFECALSQTELARCRHTLGGLIDHREDQILIVDLGSTESRTDRLFVSLGRAYSHIDAPCIVVDGTPRTPSDSEATS